MVRVRDLVPFRSGAQSVTIKGAKEIDEIRADDDDDVHEEITRKKREDPGMLYSWCVLWFQILVFVFG